MACEIEIKKSIEKSIDKQLPNREAVMSKSAAESIVKYLNNLWKSAISRIAMYSSQGGYKVVINDLTDAIKKEYKRQVEAEKEFERDIDFFNGDEALLEQERRELQNIQTQYQYTSNLSKEEYIASEKTLRDLAARMSDRIGIPVKFESDRTKKYKGRIENNTAVVNLAYATLDTPIHEILGHSIIRAIKNKSASQLYQNLLKELETGKGKEVLDRVKRDYVRKDKIVRTDTPWGFSVDDVLEKQGDYYTLEEQQEEALVELLGLYTAGRLDAVKDGKLISLLKRLLKEMKAFMRELLGQKEVEIDKLPDNMTLGDIADLLAYSNSKLILPGNEVIYTTPDNQQFKTYAEASNHISELAKSVEDVDLKNFTPVNKWRVTGISWGYDQDGSIEQNGYIYEEFNTKEEAEEYYNRMSNVKYVGELTINNPNSLPQSFIDRNKQYEQSKEIIEEWKRVNNIQYNPEEIYSRGQEFVSVVGAYSDFDVNLMMQNLLQHIEDNEKAGGEFTISAFTKPIDRKIGHLEGGGGKIKFKIYPQSKDIKWAANTDVYSGSVWNASKEVSKDKESELLGVSYTKYPSLSNIKSVQPNLASIVDDLAHHHNELGISLTGNNFRLEYDENIPYSTKKIIDSINSILDQKYGKLVKPEIKQKEFGTKYIAEEESAYGDFKTTIFNTEQEALDYKKSMEEYDDVVVRISKQVGIQPTQTNETLKESIESVKSNIQYDRSKKGYFVIATNDDIQSEVFESLKDAEEKLKEFEKKGRKDGTEFIIEETFIPQKIEKEYTSQALINTKIAKLKEVAKKYPRSLIRSEVRRIPSNIDESLFDFNELPFQKIPDTNQKDLFLQKKSSERTITSKANQKTINAVKDFLNRIGVSYKSVSDIYVNGVKLDENAIANITRRIIEVIDGKESESLPEEAMHFLVEIVQQTNPKLFNELLKEANNYQLTRDIFADYSTDPLYQTKDGKPDVIKLKKEAIAKILVETIIKRNEGLTEKPQLLAKTQSLFDKILNWFRSLFIQSGFDKLARDVLSGKDLGTVEDIVIDQEEDLIYLQKSSQPSQEEVFNSLKENGKTVEKKGNDGYFINGKKIPRVSDIVASWYDRRSKSRDITKSEFETAVDDLKSEKGTSGHSDIEFAFSRFVDENGYLRNPEDYLEDGNYVSQLNPNDGNKMYSLLKKNLQERLESFPDGTRFLAETIVYSPKRNLAGTIDFIAVEPDGKINILDWKFMSLNTNRYEDVPWYKVNSWQIQMEEYKAILSDVLKVKDGSFKQTRMIPIRAVYSGANVKENILPKLLELEIGGVNVKDIEEDYLLPVGLEKETTGNKKIDDLLEKLNNVYKKISEKKALPSEKATKAEQLNSLFYAIRQLQIKQNVKPLVEQTIILNKQIKAIIDEYNEKFKDKPANSFSEKEINEFAKTLELGREAIQTYENLDIELKFLFEGELDEEMKELKSQLRDAVDDSRENAKELEEVDKLFTQEIIAMSEGVENLSTPEKIVKGLTKLFGSTSTIQLRSLQVLYKKANKAFGFSAMEVQEEAQKLSALRDEYMKWAKRKGLSPKNMFDIIRKKDKNELIDEFDKDFYKQLKQNISKKDISWIKENINIDEYTQYLKEKKEKEIDFIKNKTRTGTPERIKADILRELAKVEELYSLTGEVQLGWLLYDDVKKFPKKRWESKEWKELMLPENKPAKDFYDYIKERNAYYESIGYINAKQARTFLPWVRKGLAEKMIFGGQFKIGEQFLKNISMDENEVGYGQIDPITGKPVDVIPTYFTTEFTDEEYSEDLFKTMALYNQYAIKFNYLTEIDAQARALVRTERNKKSIATSIFGKTRYEDGKLKLIDDNSENTKLLESMVKAIVYQQRYIDNEAFDIVLGRLNNFGDTLNKKLGVNIFPKNLSRREISLNKTVSQLNSQFQLTALGLNALSSLSNYFGGTSQSIINAGKFFTKTDHVSTQAWVLQGKMMGGEDRKKALAAIKYFMPFTEDFNRDLPNELSIGKFNDESIQKFLMYLMRNGDAAVQTINFYSFLRNAIVVDGEIKNVREYLRSTEEYSEMYAGTKQEIDARAAKFEEDVKKLKEEKGVLAVSELKDGKLEIPGVERKSNSVIEFRRKVQQFTSDALGSMTEENKRLINLNVYGASFMIFKNWIPRLVDVRFGELKYNSASDAYEWGRTRTVAKIISQDLLRSINNLRHTLVGSEKGIDFIRNLYETKKEQYERETNKELKMTEDEFIQLVRQNLKNQLADLLFYATLFALSLMAKALVPDDDEDPMVKNQAKFIVKATDKFKDELGYFWNPTSILDLTRSGIFPSLSLIDNYKKVFLNSIAELYGLVVEDDELVEDNNVIKYFMRSFPISNQFASYLPMFYPEMAKDLGIKMQSQYGFR